MEKQVEYALWKPGDLIFKTEEQMQEQQVKWFNNIVGEPHRRMLFHVDNNSWNQIVGAKKKSLGVTSGPSDLIFVSVGETIFIENKLPGKQQSAEQIDFMNKVIRRGQRYVLCYGFEALKRFVMKEFAKHSDYEY